MLSLLYAESFFCCVVSLKQTHFLLALLLNVNKYKYFNIRSFESSAMRKKKKTTRKMKDSAGDEEEEVNEVDEPPLYSLKYQ